MVLIACSGNRPTNIGIHDSRLAPCPETPNCVSSDASDTKHNVSPFLLNVPSAQAWPEAKQHLIQLPRTHVVKTTSNYMHIEFTSAWLGFVDDLELHLRPQENIIAVRSASRLGSYDFGVNRDRVESLRSDFIKLGIIQ